LKKCPFQKASPNLWLTATCMTSRGNPLWKNGTDELPHWTQRSRICLAGSPSRLARVTPPSIGRQGRHAVVAAHVFSPCALAGRGKRRVCRLPLRANANVRRQRHLLIDTPHRNPKAHASEFTNYSSSPRRDRSHAFHSSAPATPPLSPPAGAMGSTGRDPEVTRADFPDGFVFGVATSAYQVPTHPTAAVPISHPVQPPSLGVPSRRVLAPCLRLNTARQLVLHALALLA
jgi:hypothetical protein